MNAVFRKKDELPVISNDAIEVKLNHLSDGLSEVRRSQSALETKLDELAKEIFARLDKQGERIDSLGKRLDERIDSLAKRLDAVYVSVKVVLAILGFCVSPAVIANTLRNLGWI